MPTTTTEKPSTAATIIDGGSITLDGATGSKFVIQVQRSQWRFYTPFRDVTGDADGEPTYDNNRFVYASFTLLGWMVANKAIGIVNLKDQSTPYVMGINFGSTVSFPADGGDDVAILIKAIKINHDYRSVVNSIAIAGRVTDTDLTAAGFDVG